MPSSVFDKRSLLGVFFGNKRLFLAAFLAKFLATFWQNDQFWQRFSATNDSFGNHIREIVWQQMIIFGKQMIEISSPSSK